ncbi:hypothetical protein R3P38DRAFT_2807487 [Favolaschia claudopus]|uniref:Uncharacterized protein n=1 Tax=Favolaschia claudopus TaxID=2862362 RepID=A0AAV9ZI18_9AGAR
MRKRTLEERIGEEQPARKRALLDCLSAPASSLSQRLGAAAAGGSSGSNKGEGERNAKGNMHGRGNMGRKADRGTGKGKGRQGTIGIWGGEGSDFCRTLPVPTFRRSIEECDVFFVQETHLRPDQKDKLRTLEGYDSWTMSRKMSEGQDTYGDLMGRGLLRTLWFLRIGDMHFINAYVAGEHSSASRHFSDWQALHPWDTFSVLVREMSEAGLAFSVHGDLNGRSGVLCPRGVEHPPRIAEDMVVNRPGSKID